MLINSCKKERKGNISNTEFENLNNWRVENLNNKSSTFGNLTPNWNSIYTNNLGTQTVYEISLLSSDQTFVTNGFIPKDNSEPYQAKSKIKLILFKDNKTGKITDGCYMATIADEDLHYRQTKSFTGLIYFYAKNGNFTNGWVFENGISTKSISPSTKEEYLKSKNLNFETESGTQNTGKQKLQVAANQFCYTSANPIYGLGCITVGDPPQTVCTPYIKGYYYTSFCLDVNIPTDGGFILNPSNPTNPGVPPTLPEVPDGPQKDIRNKTEDPCISKTVEEALGANKNIEEKLAEIIKNFDANKNVIINVADGQIFYKNQNGNYILDNSGQKIPKPGETTNQVFDGNTFSAKVTLGTEFHDGTSKESLTASLIHEFVHAYLGYTSNNFLKTEIDHNVIAEKYVTPMADYLKSSFNIDLKDAYALAWSGVPDSKAWDTASLDFEFTMSDGKKITKQETLNLSGPYKLSTKKPDNVGFTKGTKICD